MFVPHLQLRSIRCLLEVLRSDLFREPKSNPSRETFAKWKTANSPFFFYKIDDTKLGLIEAIQVPSIQ